MKKTLRNLITVLPLIVFACSGAYAQITPLGDSFTNTADSSTNYGAATLLYVNGATEIAYIQFNLSAIPATANISQATLKLYVNSVTTAGSFNVDYVNGAWTESTINASNAPALGGTIASGVSLTTADKNQYILINVTSAVQAWLSGSETNDGIALVANSTFGATFDSKESTSTSHPAELDIAFAGGDGTITGVTTVSGSGLSGGGTSGTLNLSLTSACASGQILQWNGSAWACASAGTGTVTGVTAGTDLTGGGSSGNVTLNLNTSALNSVYPQLATANTFTGNQTVNGNLTATGAINSATGLNIGGSQFVYGSVASQNGFFGPAGNSTMTGLGNTATGFLALSSNTSAGGITAYGAYALDSNTTGAGNSATGYQSLENNTTGYNNTASGYQALAINTTGFDNTATGWTALYSNTGIYNTATGAQALYFNSTGQSNTGDGTGALASNSTGSFNTASGAGALEFSTTGSNNTATGEYTLYSNTTGNGNTSDGYYAGNTADSSALTGNSNTAVGSHALFSTGTLTNATTIGAYAEVSESNALVLGSINGVNGAASSTFVGIGTTTPQAALDVLGATTLHALIGNGGCGTTYAGIGFIASGGFAGNCTNYALLGETNGNLYINSTQSGTIFFRNQNGANLMTINPSGDVSIQGSLSKGSGSFKIDHPLDPANKYLYHSFVESPDMMNIYNGVATLDAHGAAWITLPGYFEALNRDFRYQLTSIGRPQPSLYVAHEISGNRFRISGGKAGGRVSWQVTGIRHDAYADAHRIQVEVEKPPQEQGKYLHPELFGVPEEQAVGYHSVTPLAARKTLGSHRDNNAGKTISETRIAKGEQQ